MSLARFNETPVLVPGNVSRMGMYVDRFPAIINLAKLATPFPHLAIRTFLSDTVL